jgi:hypothetical protein
VRINASAALAELVPKDRPGPPASVGGSAVLFDGCGCGSLGVAVSCYVAGDQPPKPLPAAGTAGFGSDTNDMVAALTVALGDEQAAIRVNSAAVLGGIGPEASPALPALEHLLKDQDPRARANAVWALWMIRGRTPWPEMEALLADQDAAARACAAVLLGLLKTDDPKLRPALGVVLGDQSGRVRLAASRLALEVARDDARLIPALQATLKATDLGYELSEAYELLGRMGPAGREALPFLETMLAGKDARFIADGALAHWRISGRADAAIPALLHILTPQEHRPALYALAKMGPAAAGAAAELEAILAGHRPGIGRSLAAWAHVKVTGKADKGVSVLLEELGSANQADAISFLGEVGPPAAKAVPELEKLASNGPTPQISYQAGQALKKIRGEEAGK